MTEDLRIKTKRNQVDQEKSLNKKEKRNIQKEQFIGAPCEAI